MIKVNNISKFFFKGKPNEIKALQNINLELDEGLVMLVGKSGCGKTTLLNTLGGLEKPDCGSVTIDGTTITRYQCEQWDKLRNRTIGYVFQNYNLIDELTVYQNLELVLKLSGIEPHTYKERIEYALSLVGMEKFAKRTPSTLSGGQQQRVGIARAIVKGAKVIIADEPTGNLDDTNTIAVMELLKGLSKHCLVIVVTHEEDLAAFYADRIIRMKDGAIVDDSANQGTGSLEHRAADHVYLGDMSRREFKADEMDVLLYDDGSIPRSKVSIVCQNGRILLKVDGESKVTFVTENSSIRLDEGKYVARHVEDSDLAIDTDLLRAGTGKQKRIFSLKDCIATVFGNLKAKWGMRRRNPYRVLYLTGVFFVLAMALSAPAFLYNRDANVVVDDGVVAIRGSYTQDTLPADLPSGTVVLNRSVGSAYIDASFGTQSRFIDVGSVNSMCVMPYSAVGGTAKRGEAYIDKLLYNRMVNGNSLDGISRNAGDLVGLQLTVTVYTGTYYEPLNGAIEVESVDVAEESYVLAGVVNRNMPVLYLSDEDYAALPAVHFYNRENSGMHECTLLFNKDAGALRRALDKKGYAVQDVNALKRKAFYKDAVLRKIVYIVLAGVVILIQMFSLYRMAKNDYINKQKLYSQYRSIGVSRGAIYGKISLESGLTCMCTAMRGWLISSFIVILISNLQIVKNLTLMGVVLFYYPIWFALVCGAFMVILSQIVNMMAPLVLLSHTPAYLMSKYDI